jgi:hypothetical protein
MSEGTQRDRILGMIRQRHPNYHPLLSIADLAHSSDDEKVRLDCHKTIAKYVEPELKSIEVRGENMGGSITIVTQGTPGRDLMEDMSKNRQSLLRVIDGNAETLSIEQKNGEAA